MRSCCAAILMLGKFGMPENEFAAERIRQMIPDVVRTAIDWGCPYIAYWQLYCNEIKGRRQPTPVTGNDTVCGFWLIRPDGSKAWTWDYFYGLLHPGNQEIQMHSGSTGLSREHNSNMPATSKM